MQRWRGEVARAVACRCNDGGVGKGEYSGWLSEVAARRSLSKDTKAAPRTEKGIELLQCKSAIGCRGLWFLSAGLLFGYCVSVFRSPMLSIIRLFSHRLRSVL